MVLLQFALELAAHQFRDGVLRGFSAEERVVHGVHYREFHVHLFAERLRAPAGRNAFRDHLHVRKHVIQRFALADALAHVAVAAVPGKAGDDEVAHSGEARERVRICAHRASEAADFRLTAGDEGSARIVAAADAVDDAGSDSDHVLHGTAELDADDIRGSVDAEVGIAHHALHEFRGGFFRAGGDDSRVNAAGDFFSVRRAAQRDHVFLGKPGNVREEHFAHIFETLSITCDGTTRRTISAPSRAAFISVVYLKASGKITPGSLSLYWCSR